MPMRVLRLATMIVTLTMAASTARALPAGDVGRTGPMSLEAMRSGTPLILVKKRCGPRSILLEGRCIKKSEAAEFCGPGYRVQGDKCVHGAYEGSSKGSPGCPAGQVWSAQEGCHYDD